MEKHIYLIRGSKSEGYEQFKKRILAVLDSPEVSTAAATIKVTLTSEKRPSFSIIPFKKNKIAVISVYTDNDSAIDSLISTDGFAGVYRVQEALPVRYEKTWPDREPTPGVCLLTLFKSKKGINYETFIDRWHNGHTPMSLKLHPLWNYNRNVVQEKLADNSEYHDGIVEEQFNPRKELLNPCIFFGPPLKVPLNMIKVYLDTKSFIDYKSMETYFAEEIHIKS